MKKIDRMNKIWLFVIMVMINISAKSQQDNAARILLDDVSETMKSYTNMVFESVHH